MKASIAALVLGAHLCSLVAAGLDRGIIYVQPSYHFASTLDLDLAVLRTDLDAIASAGFVNVGLRTSWGEIMSKWDGETGKATWNDESCATLAAVAVECAKRKLRLIFNTHLRDTVPEGVEGAYFVNHTAPDSRGVVPRPYWTSTFVDHMVRDSYREPMVLFHTKFAQCLRASPTVPRFWKHSFESAYVFPQTMTNAQVTATAPAANEKFRLWAADTNPDIAHWAQRWNEGDYLRNFSQITIPHQTQHALSAAKFGDFWRFWLLGVLKQGKYGLSIGNIFGGLADGAGESYVPGLAFKHWKPKNFEDPAVTDLAMAELKEAFDLPINATALGYYVNDAPSLAAEPASFQAYVRSVKAVAPPALPVIIWETGASTWNLTESQQASWATMMMATSEAEGVAGFNWWQFIDWAPTPSQQPCTQQCGAPPCNTQCQLLHFGAHTLDGKPKAVWDVLKSPASSTESEEGGKCGAKCNGPADCDPSGYDYCNTCTGGICCCDVRKWQPKCPDNAPSCPTKED